MTPTVMLKALANGVHPETGEVLPQDSIVNKPEVIRLLFALSEELSATPEKAKKTRLTDEERQQKNLAEGRPAKSHFPWTEEEKHLLAGAYQQHSDIDGLSATFERSSRAVAVQLEKMGLISLEQLVAYSQ